MIQNCAQILCVFKPKAEYELFCKEELKSLLNLEEVAYTISDWLPQDETSLRNFANLVIQTKDLPKLQGVINRSVLIRTFLELYSCSTDGSAHAIKLALEDSSSLKTEIGKPESCSFLITAEYHTMK